MTARAGQARGRAAQDRFSAGNPSIGRITRLVCGIALLALALPPFLDFPWLDFWLVPLAAIYLFLLAIMPRLWLVVLPLATVGLDITPFTGRFAYNELDLLFVVTLASSLLYNRYRLKVFTLRLASVVLFLYLAVIALGYSGWEFFLLPPGAAMDNPYYTSDYTYKMLKGMVWGIGLVPMWGYLLAVDKQRSVDALVTGMSCAAVLLGLIVLWERGTLGVIAGGSPSHHVVSSLMNLTSSYRVTGIFSDMHTGGEALDGVLLLLFPVTMYGAMYGRAIWVRVLGSLGMMSLAYVTLVGFTLATFAAFAIALLLYSVLTLLSRYRNSMPLPVPLSAPVAASGTATELNRAIVLGGVLVLSMVIAFGGYQINDRASRVSSDLELLENHWRNVVDSTGSGFLRSMLGNGVGRFPSNYIAGHPEMVRSVGSFSIAREENRYVLRMGGGHDLKLGQRVTIEPYTNYSVDMHLRADQPGHVRIALCERNLIYASNFVANCRDQTLRFPATGGIYRKQTVELNSGQVGERGALMRWPTVMTIQYDQLDTVLEIDAVELSAAGFNVLRNSSFKGGLDYWFAYNDFSHLPWHVKNTFLQVWFESGWLGLGLFLALLALLAHSNFKRHAYDSLVPVYTTAVLTVCLFGFFGSPLDSSRVSWIFYFFLAAGLAQLKVRGKSRAVSGPGV